jgi:hypothetical protein
MPFLKAGFNWRHRSTGIRGWTRSLEGGRQFAPAELIRFAPKGTHTGDYAWLHLAQRPRFIAWGEQCTFGSWHGFDLPWEYQNGLAHSDLDTRKESPAWRWVEERREKLAAGEPLDD